MRETQRKGDIAVAKAISSFTSKGADVSIPLSESCLYDLIVDYVGVIWRVQVKYSKNPFIDLRRIHSNSKGYVVKQNISTGYDCLYVLHDNKEYLIPSSRIGKQNNIKVTEEYLLEKYFF